MILSQISKSEKGNFYEKEKRVALLFGFESFEGKREPAGNGDFGYYMVRVEI